MKKITIAFILFFCISAPTFAGKPWYKKWDSFPDVPRIHKKKAKELIMSGNKVAFVYSGYKTESIICGSFYIPYTAVPPASDGSRVVLPFPKDYWILCY